MNSAELRSRFRVIVFAVVGVIIALLVFRIIFDIAGAYQTNVIVQFIYTLTTPLISPFYGFVRSPITPVIGLNIDAIIAIIGYLVGAIIFAEIVTSFMEESSEQVVENLIDGLFKLVEFLLLIRIILEVFGIYETFISPGSVRAIYELTNWSQGILPRFQYGTGFLDASAILCLIIVAILDAVIDSVLNSLFNRIKRSKKVTTQSSSSFVAPRYQPAPMPQSPLTPLPQPRMQNGPTQSIVVNIPQQPVQQQARTEVHHVHHINPNAIQQPQLLPPPQRVPPVVIDVTSNQNVNGLKPLISDDK